MKEYNKHPAAGLFRDMTDEEYESLKQDVTNRGFLDPIIVVGDEIVDGWHRYKIAQELKIPLDSKTKDGRPLLDKLPAGIDPWSYTWSKNYLRRHLDAGQRACAAVEYERHRNPPTTLGAQAPALAAHQPKKRGRRPKWGNITPIAPKGKTAQILADQFGVSDRYVKLASKLHDKDPQKFEKVLHGEITLSKAANGVGSAPKILYVEKKRVTMGELCERVPGLGLDCKGIEREFVKSVGYGKK